jgi:hypothetical protein
MDVPSNQPWCLLSPRHPSPNQPRKLLQNQPKRLLSPLRNQLPKKPVRRDNETISLIVIGLGREFVISIHKKSEGTNALALHFVGARLNTAPRRVSLRCTSYKLLRSRHLTNARIVVGPDLGRSGAAPLQISASARDGPCPWAQAVRRHYRYVSGPWGAAVRGYNSSVDCMWS